MSETKPVASTPSHHERMGTAPLLPLIIKMSLPSMFSMLIQSLYNIVDGIYVSRLGESALSAVSLIMGVFPLVDMLITVNNCMGDLVGTFCVAKSENLVDMDVYRSKRS